MLATRSHFVHQHAVGMRNLAAAMITPCTDPPSPQHPSMLQLYKSMCTTCIVGNAIEESKTGSYDEDSKFDRFDILDPDFPCNVADPSDAVCRPDHVLMDLCGGLAEQIVCVMGDMERSWTTRCTKIKESDYKKANALWGFVKDRASTYIDLMHGSELSAEFGVLGDELFNQG